MKKYEDYPIGLGDLVVDKKSFLYKGKWCPLFINVRSIQKRKGKFYFYGPFEVEKNGNFNLSSGFSWYEWKGKQMEVIEKGLFRRREYGYNEDSIGFFDHIERRK